MLCWTKQRVDDVSKHLNTEESTRFRVDDDVCFIEFACDSERVIITDMLTPNDVHKIVTNVALLQDLLWIVRSCGHLGNLVEDNFGSRVSPIYSTFSI